MTNLGNIRKDIDLVALIVKVLILLVDENNTLSGVALKLRDEGVYGWAMWAVQGGRVM